MMKRSIIEYYAENERYKCGYCKKPDSNYSHGKFLIILLYLVKKIIFLFIYI